MIVLFAVIGSAAGIGLTVMSPKIYRASVVDFVGLSSAVDTTQYQQGNSFVQARVQNYLTIATSPTVLSPVVKDLGLDMTTQKLAGKVKATAPQNRSLITISVTDRNPEVAARLANAITAEFNSVVPKIEQTDQNGRPLVKLSVVHPATVPSAPVSPRKAINILGGMMLGLLIGVAVVAVRDLLDNTVRGPKDFEELGVPVLGSVPMDKRATQAQIAFRDDAHSPRAEAYRQLRTNLQFVDVDNPPKIIAVTSAMPGEGKSTTAVNLAAALAEAGFRTCLIETDLRRPSLAGSLGLIGDVGFTSVLIGATQVEDVLQNAGRNLAVLTSGPVPPNPSELLVTDQARNLIHSIADEVDFVVLDTAPLLPVTDGAEMATIADVTLLVHRLGKTTHDQAVRAVQALAKVGERPVGVVLNMISRGNSGAYGYEYGYYYGEYAPGQSSGASAGKRGRSGSRIPRLPEDQAADLTTRTSVRGEATHPLDVATPTIAEYSGDGLDTPPATFGTHLEDPTLTAHDDDEPGVDGPHSTNGINGTNGHGARADEDYPVWHSPTSR